MSKDAVAGLWLAIASILLFGMSFARSHAIGDNAQGWRRRLIDALTKSLVFAALSGMFYFLLSSNYASFSQIYGSFTIGGSISNQHWQEWHNLYGGTCTQGDLQVRQYVTTEAQEAIEPTDPSSPVLYHNVQIEQPVTQNSISSFNGQVTMDLADPVNQTEPFNGYTLTALYEYEISNPAATETRIEFTFPLPLETRLYQDVSIKMDGKEVSSRHIDAQAIIWEDRMSPGQKRTVSIQYLIQGMDRFRFEIPEAREVTDFQLEMAVNASNDTWMVTEPENGGIQVETREEPPYQITTWRIDRAIIGPRLGVDLRQMWPYDPYYNLIATLSYAARALVLFLCLVVLTLLICDVPVWPRQMALMASLFALPFLVLMAGDFLRLVSLTPRQFTDWQLWALPVLSILSLSLAFITLRKTPRLPLALVLLIMAAFINGYIRVGLLPDEQKRNAAESMVQVGMIAYVVLLTLFIRVRSIVRVREHNRRVEHRGI
ncbi:MAG: hypothetical protein JXB07_16930 [Anaerolineae bacterium]|nr:hypothetical protein [Anaerolineae bacterium]